MFKNVIYLYNLEKYVLSTYNLPDRKFEDHRSRVWPRKVLSVWL